MSIDAKCEQLVEELMPFEDPLERAAALEGDPHALVEKTR